MAGCGVCSRGPLARPWCCGSLSSARRWREWLTWWSWRWRIKRAHGFFIRGWRGWANHDIGSLDHHIAGILKDALRLLADRNDSAPGSFVEFDADGNAVDIDRDAARWQAWLRDKAEWFEWYWRDDDCLSLYGDSPGTKEQKDECARAHLAKAEEFRSVVLPDFIKHFESLWT